MESPKVHQTITLLYGAFLASSFVYVMVAVFLMATEWRPVKPQLSLPLFVGFLLIAVVNASIVLKQKNALFSTTPTFSQNDFRQFLMARCVLWFALSEFPAILGFIFFIFSGNLVAMCVLVGISAVSFTLAKPSLSQIEELENRRDGKAQR